MDIWVVSNFFYDEHFGEYLNIILHFSEFLEVEYLGPRICALYVDVSKLSFKRWNQFVLPPAVSLGKFIFFHLCQQ